MLCGIRRGHSRPQDLPKWNARSTCKWLDDVDETTYHHIKLVTLTGAIGQENEFLHGELGPIANAVLSIVVSIIHNSRIPHSSQYGRTYS